MAIIEWDSNFIVTRWVGQSEKIFGWKANETIGKPIMELNMIFQEDITIVQKTLEQLTEGISKNVVSFNRNYTKDGRVIYCEWYNSVLADEQGKMISVFSQVLDVTERIQLEQQLRIKERALESSSNGILITDPNLPDNPVIYCNSGFEKITGYTKEEVIGKNCRFLQNNDRNQPGLISIRKAIRAKKHVKEIIRNYRKDGSMFWNELTISPVTDSEGHVTHFVGIQDDNTRRVQDKMTLKNITTSLTLALQIGRIGSFEYHIPDDKVTWTDEMFRIFGLEPRQEPLTIEKVREMIHPDDRKLHLEQTENIIKEGYYSFEHRVAWPDGSTHWIIGNARMESDVDTNPTLIIGTAQDITIRKQFELKLIESGKLYRSLIDNMLNDFAYCRMHFDHNQSPSDFTYLIVNQSFKKNTGLVDVEGKKASEVIPGIREKDPKLFEIYGRVAITGKAEKFEIFLNSMQQWYLVSVYCPEVYYFVAVSDAITELKKIEEEKRKSTEIREELIKHITNVREEERAFISREIHDQLGQSLTALKLDLKWLQSNSSKSTETKEKLSGMVDIIDSTIKDVQRISAELRPGILDDLGLAAAIEWYAEEFEKRTGLSVELNLDEIQTNNESANLALFRIMQESLTNVIRHARAKTIQISLHEINDHVVLDIEDDGIGISIDKLKSIHSLGLMGMHDRIKQVGGTLDILCGDEKGTQLRICIPILETNIVVE